MHAERNSEDRILAHCTGLARWLDADDERRGARDELRGIVGERLYRVLVGGLAR